MKFSIVEKNNVDPWGRVIYLNNKIVELVIPTQIGPRIVGINFVGEENVFFNSKEMNKHFGSMDWFPYGGHRLWHAPEEYPRTLCPDNEPIKIRISEHSISLIQNIENLTKIQKIIEISLDTNGNNIFVRHKLINHGCWPVKFAAWGITMMAPGGLVVIPLPPKVEFLEKRQPDYSIVVWPWTNLTDNRFKIRENYLTVEQDPQKRTPQKIGLSTKEGWAGYFYKSYLFIKRFKCFKDFAYPDLGSTIEVFTDQNTLEIESLSPYKTVNPGDSIEHVEEWFIYKDVSFPENETEIRRILFDYATSFL